MCRCHLSYTFMYAPGTKMTKNNTQFQYSGWKGKAVLVPPSDNNVPWKWALPLPRRWITLLQITNYTPPKSDLWDLWPLRHLLRVMRKHDLRKGQQTTKSNLWDLRPFSQYSWHYWEMRTHFMHTDLTIKSDPNPSGFLWNSLSIG